MPSKLFAHLGLSQKTAYGIHMAMYGTPTLYIFEKYVFNDWDFLVSLCLLVFLDTLFGSVASLIDGTFKPSEGLKKFGLKVLALTGTLLCIGVIDNALIAGERNWLSGVIDAGAFAIMMGFEGASVLKNLYRIYPLEVVKNLLSRLEVYYDRQKKKVDPNQ